VRADRGVSLPARDEMTRVIKRIFGTSVFIGFGSKLNSREITWKR
jgi:hypothetical protein